MRPILLLATFGLQLLMVAAGFCVPASQLQSGWLTFDILAVVPPFMCYAVALYSAPFLSQRHPVVRFAVFTPAAMTVTIAVYLTLKLIGCVVGCQRLCEWAV